MIYRNGFGNGDEITIKKTLRVTGTGAITANVLQVYGNIRITEQYATIKSITTLVNATNVYADVYDGTNTIDVTADGAVLSGFPAESFFTKDKDSSETYTASKSDEVRFTEVSNESVVGKPFTVTQKNGADTFIRLHLTTTDTPVDFEIDIVFKYERLCVCSNLVFL